MITPAEREFVLNLLDDSERRVLAMLDGLSAEQLLYRTRAGSWSVAENVEHLIVVERRLVGAIEKLLQGPPDFEKRCSLTDEDLIQRVGTVVTPAQAPEHALPTLRWPAESLAHEYESTRRRTREFATTTPGDLRRYFMRHFLFGELDGYQWLLLIGSHSKRHCAQAERVKASREFPAAYSISREEPAR